MNTKEKVSLAFRELRKKGYWAKQNVFCCQSCGWYELERTGRDEKAVFYHHQDNDAWKGKELKKDLYFAWSGDIAEITAVFEKAGVPVLHNGREDVRFMLPRTIWEE